MCDARTEAAGQASASKARAPRPAQAPAFVPAGCGVSVTNDGCVLVMGGYGGRIKQPPVKQAAAGSGAAVAGAFALGAPAAAAAAGGSPAKAKAAAAPVGAFAMGGVGCACCAYFASSAEDDGAARGRYLHRCTAPCSPARPLL